MIPREPAQGGELGFTEEDAARPFLPPGRDLVQDAEQPRFWWCVQEMVKAAGLTYRKGTVIARGTVQFTPDWEDLDPATARRLDYRLEVKVLDTTRPAFSYKPTRSIDAYGHDANAVLAELRRELGADLRRDLPLLGEGQ